MDVWRVYVDGMKKIKCKVERKYHSFALVDMNRGNDKAGGRITDT